MLAVATVEEEGVDEEELEAEADAAPAKGGRTGRWWFGMGGEGFFPFVDLEEEEGSQEGGGGGGRLG